MTDGIIQKPQFNIEEFSKKSEDFYNEIRDKLETNYKDKYIALDFETKEYWFGDIPSDALLKAKKKYPDKIFYLIQVGSPTAFSIQSISSVSFLKKKCYDNRGRY